MLHCLKKLCKKPPDLNFVVPYGIGEREKRPEAAQNRQLTQRKKFLLSRTAENILFEQPSFHQENPAGVCKFFLHLSQG